jgi:hypothetical protein
MIVFQKKIATWMEECFGKVIPYDRTERNHWFLEEALELVRSLDCSKADALALVDCVYGRKAGNPPQEVGGVMVTLAALCNVHKINIAHEATTESIRIWNKIDEIREKQAKKPPHSARPQ